MPSKGELYAGIRQDNQEIPEIVQLRGVTATLIDNLDQLDTQNPGVARLIAIAQSKYEEACMFAVKAIYTAVQSQDDIVPTAHDPAIDQ
jgi:hypothetical protein